jgi:Tol biopolymer transport system component
MWDEDIYSIDAATGGGLRKLTHGNYNEHAFSTPDGKSIVWMTNRESTKGGTDWWVMNSDGSGKRRLTYINEPGNPQYASRAVGAGPGSFSPDGKRFVGDFKRT